MEILDELLECEVGVIVPHLKTVIEFCLQVSIFFHLSSSDIVLDFCNNWFICKTDWFFVRLQETKNLKAA